MPLYELEGKRPKIGRGSFIHPDAVLIGGVTIGEGCWVSAGAVLRGDWGNIVVGDGSNIQDNVVIHVKPDHVAILARDSHIGHGAILHGPTLEENVLVGMGAIILDNVRVGRNTIIAAGAVVMENQIIPEGKLVMGSPARVVRDLSQELMERKRWGTRMYQTLPRRYGETLRRIADAQIQN